MRRAGKLMPLFDRVLVERFAQETTTKSGIFLPEKSLGKVLNATVVAVGQGMRKKDGSFQSMAVQVGDQVLLPEYGGTKVEMDKKEFFVFRESDIIGKWE
ncbi:hypothetical protein SNEBB_005103 [Seison nebaliae]|nr:hypothetical protein SNEBB_005103 [Seison nebaliae]